ALVVERELRSAQDVEVNDSLLVAAERQDALYSEHETPFQHGPRPIAGKAQRMRLTESRLEQRHTRRRIRKGTARAIRAGRRNGRWIGSKHVPVRGGNCVTHAEE